MSYEQKTDLLNYFFNAWDDDGKRYGITVQKNAQGEFELELYGRYLMGPDSPSYMNIKPRQGFTHLRHARPWVRMITILKNKASRYRKNVIKIC